MYVHYVVQIALHDTVNLINNKKKYLILISEPLVWGAILSYIGSIFLMIAFCAPYWIESYPESFSSFLHMGLWEYCFRDFQYPYYQFPKLFNGCHHIFSHVSFLYIIIAIKREIWEFFFVYAYRSIMS